jgi:hypothetical protein
MRSKPDLGELFVASRETSRLLLRYGLKRDWDACGGPRRVLHEALIAYMGARGVRSKKGTFLWWAASCGFWIGVALGLDWIWHHGRSFFLTGAVVGAIVVLLATLYSDRLIEFLRRPSNRAIESGGSPPRTAQYLLFLVPRRYREGLIGDLEEDYRTRVLPTYGRRWAVVWYWWQVSAAFGHFLLRLLTGLAAVWRLIR